jgi:hypothetical protein
MNDAADFELQKEPPLSMPPPAPRPSFTPIVAAAVVVVAVAVGAFVYLNRDAAPASPTTGAIATDTSVPPPAPLGVAVTPIELPPLDESDDVVRQLVRALSSHPSVVAWLATDGLIRNFTVVVENIASGRTPAPRLRVLKPSQPFATADAGNGNGDVVIDPRSYSRYNDLAAAVSSINPKGAATLYSTLKPRIEEAYRELGETGSFDRELEAAIVLLLDTPVVGGEVALLPRGGLYVYNDLRIERLTPAQKQLVRMGARNIQTVQRTLRQIALALGIPPERLPAA